MTLGMMRAEQEAKTRRKGQGKNGSTRKEREARSGSSTPNVPAFAGTKATTGTVLIVANTS